MEKQILCFLILILGSTNIKAQDTLIQWQSKCSGGGYIEDMAINAKGEIITVGYWEGADYILNLSKEGKQKWYSSNWPKKLHPRLSSVIPIGGGYIYAGEMVDFWRDEPTRLLVGKIDSSGVRGTDFIHGDSFGIYCNKIIETFDEKNFVVVGGTYGHKGFNFYAIKMDASFKIIWEKSFGGDSFETANSIIQTPDSGFILVGNSNSINGDVSTNYGREDVWVIKLDKDGKLIWEKSFGGSKDDEAYSIIKANDGGYLIAGTTSSNDKDIKKTHGKKDVWLLKINDNGSLLWQKTFGGDADEEATTIARTKDSFYIIGGHTWSGKSGDVTYKKGQSDIWILKLKDSNLVWQKTYGGYNQEYLSTLKVTNENEILFSGHSSSCDSNGNLSGDSLRGLEGEPWIVQLGDKTVGIKESQKQKTSPSLYPNPCHTHLNITNAITPNTTAFIIDINGRILMSKALSDSNMTIDVSELPKGIFLLKLQNTVKVIIEKFVKE